MPEWFPFLLGLLAGGGALALLVGWVYRRGYYDGAADAQRLHTWSDDIMRHHG